MSESRFIYSGPSLEMVAGKLTDSFGTVDQATQPEPVPRLQTELPPSATPLTRR